MSLDTVSNHSMTLLGPCPKLCSDLVQWLPHSTTNCAELLCDTILDVNAIRYTRIKWPSPDTVENEPTVLARHAVDDSFLFHNVMHIWHSRIDSLWLALIHARHSPKTIVTCCVCSFVGFHTQQHLASPLRSRHGSRSRISKHFV